MSATALGLAVLRVTLGAIFLMHAYLAGAVVGLDGIAGYTIRMGYPEALGPALAWYLVLAHGVGGVFLVLGLWTRWAALAQVPIMASALLLHHARQGFFLKVVTGAGGGAVAGGYEYVLLVLAATVTLVLAGGGALAVHRR
jgi:putative oxidoreductase